MESELHSANLYINTFLVLGGIAIACLIYFPLRAGNRWFAELQGASDFVLTPDWAVWLLPTLFGSLTLPWLLVEALLPRVWSPVQAHRYLYLNDLKNRCHSGRLMMAFGWLWLFIFVDALLGVPVHTTFHASSIRDRDYASWEVKEHSYRDIVALEEFRGYLDRYGDFHPSEQLRIRFADGTALDTNVNIRDLAHDDYGPLMAYLEAKTGMTFQRLRVDPGRDGNQ